MAKKYGVQSVVSDVTTVEGALRQADESALMGQPKPKAMAPNDPKTMKGYDSLGRVPTRGKKSDNRGEGT